MVTGAGKRCVIALHLNVWLTELLAVGSTPEGVKCLLYNLQIRRALATAAISGPRVSISNHGAAIHLHLQLPSLVFSASIYFLAYLLFSFRCRQIPYSIVDWVFSFLNGREGRHVSQYRRCQIKVVL